ncbi:MAG: hypothetical protein ACRDX9_11030, partial [Acidimicrobiia bacterium]
YATTESQLKIAFNRITDALRQIGEVIAPIVADLANFAAVAAEAFAALPDPVKNFVLALGGIALVTPPLLSIAGGLAKAYGRVAGAMINAIVPAGTLSGKLAGHVATFDAVGASATTAAVGTSRFALALNGLTKATFVIGGLIALREILGTIDDQVDEINVGAAANELRDLAETGKFAGETLRRVFENFPGGDPVAMRQAADDLNKLDDALAELATRDPRAAAEAFDLISGRLNDLGASAGQIKDKFDDYAAVVEESGDASSDATGGVDDLAGSFDEQAGATEEATSALEDFSDALKAQFDPLFGMVDALEGQKQAMQDLRDRERELQELQASGTATTEELQAAEEALSGARTTAAKSVVDLQVASNDLKNEMLNGGLTAEDARAKFIDMALTMGFTKGEAKAMADMFGFATGKAQELGRQEANPTVKAVGVDGTLREFERVRGRLVDLDGRTASILIQTTHRTVFEEQRRGFTTSGPQLRRQHGGPVFAGDLALVGEAGPEVGVFSRSGQVLSHADSMRAAATAMSVGGGSGGGRMVIDFRVSGDDDFLNREIHRRFRAGRIQLSVNGQRVQVA